jgi:hypothetical protein
VGFVCCPKAHPLQVAMTPYRNEVRHAGHNIGSRASRGKSCNHGIPLCPVGPIWVSHTTLTAGSSLGVLGF